MFMIHLPRTFKVGDTAACRVNAEPAQVTWRDASTLVIEPDDARTILSQSEAGDDLVCFICADSAGTYRHSATRDEGVEGHTWEGPGGPYHVTRPLADDDGGGNE